LKQKLLILLILLNSFSAFADEEIPQYQYVQHSENEKFYFRTIPSCYHGSETSGMTSVYDSENDKKLYTIKNYMPFQSFLSNTGMSLVKTLYWMWDDPDFEKQPLVEIFINGKSSVKYFVNDLIEDKSRLQTSVSHLSWQFKISVINDILNLLTVDNKVVRIDLATGKIIGRISNTNPELFPKKKKSGNKNILKFSNIDLVTLSSGKPFRKALIELLGKTETGGHFDCRYFINLTGIIDRSGNCKIDSIEATVDGKENEALKKKVSTWIIKQKYSTDSIPEDCDKRPFNEYFFLK
jgi:hypothetical protein